MFFKLLICLYYYLCTRSLVVNTKFLEECPSWQEFQKSRSLRPWLEIRFRINWGRIKNFRFSPKETFSRNLVFTIRDVLMQRITKVFFLKYTSRICALFILTASIATSCFYAAYQSISAIRVLTSRKEVFLKVNSRVK